MEKALTFQGSNVSAASFSIFTKVKRQLGRYRNTQNK